MNELKYKIRSKDFQGLISRKIKLPQIEVIREVLKRIDLSGLEDLTSSIVKKARENKVFKKGTIDGYTVAAHNAVFMSLVGNLPRLTIGFELYQGSSDRSKKTEGELTVAKRRLGINNKITPVVHIKENNISSIKEIKSKINKSKYKEEWLDSKRSCVVKTYEEGFKMYGVTETLRFVKFSKKTPEGK